MCSTATKTTRLSNDDDNVNRHNNKEREQHRQCHLRLMQLCEYSNNNNNTTDTTTRYNNKIQQQDTTTKNHVNVITTTSTTTMLPTPFTYPFSTMPWFSRIISEFFTCQRSIRLKHFFKTN